MDDRKPYNFLRFENVQLYIHPHTLFRKEYVNYFLFNNSMTNATQNGMPFFKSAAISSFYNSEVLTQRKLKFRI